MDSSTTPSLDDCLKLLRGDRDEQKLAGLLLATKFCQGDDFASVLKVYNAVGPQFLHRLLLTGMGKGVGGVMGGEDLEAYLRLSVTVLAALCRVPEIAASDGMVSKVSLISEVISKSSDPSIFDECYEFLLLVAGASQNGTAKFYEPGVMDLLAPHISALSDGSRTLELGMQLMKLVVSQLSFDIVNSKNVSGILCMVTSITRLFAVLHNALKFDALHMLTTLLLSSNIVLHEALKSISTDIWVAQVHAGIATVLRSKVVSTERIQALLLADLMMAILGENWLLEHNKLQDDQKHLPVDKFLLLVLESSRIEVAVLLNELAYLKHEVSKSSSNAAETIVEKQRFLAITFSLIEKIIKLISNICSAQDTFINEDTLMKVIAGLNETTILVLDFLQDSKDHGKRKGDDLLAAVRIVGSYLAETPSACKEKTWDLLGYLLTIEGEDEQRPFYSVCFMLPMLCQITVDIDGCKALASVGGHKVVVECLVNMVASKEQNTEEIDRVFLACDTILNLLLNRKELKNYVEGSQFLQLLHTLPSWSESSKDPSIVMMASSICSLALDLTSEESLLNVMNFDLGTLEKLSELIIKSLSQGGNEHSDLHEIILSGYLEWADRFPHVRVAVEHALNI